MAELCGPHMSPFLLSHPRLLHFNTNKDFVGVKQGKQPQTVPQTSILTDVQA